MDVINVRDPANILGAPARCMPYLSATKDSDLDRCYFSEKNRAECYNDDEEELCQLTTSKSLDSLNTLLDKLPDIVIPEPVYNPLPLQCLAASSLPESVRCEIDTVLQEFCVVLKSPSHVLRRHCAFEKLRCGGQVEPMSGIMGEQSVKKMEEGKSKEESETKSAGEEEPDGASAKKEVLNEEQNDKAGDETHSQVSLERIVVEKEVTNLDNINDLGVGFRVSGGVRCPSCKSLHTVITSVSEHCSNPAVKEGLSVREWSGKDLEGCSNEEVRVFLSNFQQSEASTVELLLKKCRSSGNFVARPKEDGSRVAVLGAWQSMRRAKRPDIRRRSKRKRSRNQSSEEEPAESPNNIPLSKLPEISDSQSPPPAATSVPLAPPPLRSRRTSSPRPLSRSHSPSPSPETVPKGVTAKNENETTIVSIPRLDSNARELSVRPRSPIAKEDGHFSRFANGMIQLAMRYDSEVEDLQVALCKVKGQSNKEISDSSDVFINTYLIPDPKDQGVRSIGVNKSKSSNNSSSSSNGVGDQLTSSGSFPVRTSGEEPHSYMLKKEELEQSAVRIILWDASKSKKTVFRGEVLLSLSDSSVISLTGQPMWFTVCPVDPNLPPLPKPVHYKSQSSSQQQRNSALSRFMQKAQAITSSTSNGSIRQSVTLNDGFHHLPPATPPSAGGGKGGFTLRLSPKHRKAKSGHLDGNVLSMLNGSAGMVDGLPATRHTINEAKLARLNSIISVLKQSVEDEDLEKGNSKSGGAVKDEKKKRVSTPEFVNIFKQQTTEDNSQNVPPVEVDDTVVKTATDVTKGKKKSKPPRTMLRALKEDFVDSSRQSEYGDESKGDNHAHSGLNEQSMAWLASRKKDLELAASSSDPFKKIPTLKESLHGGKLNRVTNYMFESSSEGHLTTNETPAEPEFTGDLDGGASEPNQHQQLHYKLVDTKAQAEEDNERSRQALTNGGSRPTSLTIPQAVSSPDCKCYPVPVEVSVHRISVVDVDRQQEQAKGDITRAKSVDGRPAGVWSKKEKEGSESTGSPLVQTEGTRHHGMFQRPASGNSRKERSLSMGDMELLSTDEEVLLIRTPCTGQQVAQHECLDEPKLHEREMATNITTLSASSPAKPSPVVILEETFESPHEEEVLSSLDYTPRESPKRASQTAAGDKQKVEVTSPPFSPSDVVVRRVKIDRPSEAPNSREMHPQAQSSQGMLGVGDKNVRNRSSWVEILDRPSEQQQQQHLMVKQGKLTKHRSLDNLIDSSTANDKRSSKGNWKQNYVYGQTPFQEGAPKQTIMNGVSSEGTISGSAKLQLEYNDLNPHKPVLLVKLLDILLQSSKNLSSELVLKCYVLHTSTRVCIIKDKTVVNIKNPLPSAPLGILQFQTDFSNLTLEITFWSLGKLFSSKKEIGKVSLELNSLQLSRDSPYLEWVPIVKSPAA